MPRERWNHNVHYHRLILDAIPQHALTALDVGTGNGLLAAELEAVVPSVSGIDLDEDALRSARAEAPGVTWVHGDVLTHPFAPGSFDLVASVATIHHLPDLRQAFARLRELTAPHGVVAVVGLARSTRPSDALVDVVGVVQHQYFKRRRFVWEHTAPVVWPPPHSYVQVRDAVRTVLPGATWKRLPLWRYAVLWENSPR